MGLTNEERVQKWINEQKPGRRFTTKGITHTLNMDPIFLGFCFKWMPGVRKGAILPGNVQEWIIDHPSGGV